MSEKLIGRYEMLWDCSFCGATKLLGITHRHCPECGAAQDQTKRYFPSEGEKVAVSDDYAGTDKACPNCNHANGLKATFCVSCGAPLDEAAKVKQRSDQVVKQGQQFASDDAKAAEAELGNGPRPKPAPKKRSYTWLWILFVVVGLGFLIWFMCIRKKSVELEVAEQRWTRSIAIEEYREVSEEAWKTEVPTGARAVTCRDKQKETKKVEDGQDCSVRRVDKGDGTFEEKQECKPKYRDEPVMKPFCSFKIDRWTELEVKQETATGGAEPAWPATGVKSSPTQQGARREGERKETFEVDLLEGTKKHTCAVGKDVWTKLTKGTEAKGEVRARSGDIVCDTVRAK